jgi:hypothetical protein
MDIDIDGNYLDLHGFLELRAYAIEILPAQVSEILSLAPLAGRTVDEIHVLIPLFLLYYP